MPEGCLGRVSASEVGYNRVAVKVMEENHIPIDDLHNVAEKNLSKIQHPNNVHFTEQGYQELTQSVAASIESALKK